MDPKNQSQSGGFTGAGGQQPSQQTQPLQHAPSAPSSPPAGRDYLSTQRTAPTQAQREATVNVLRSQIDTLYESDRQPQVAATQPATPHTPAAAAPTIDQTVLQHSLDTDSPYSRTHASTEPKTAIDQKQWKEYHSAWQDYYQKYYAAYYAHQDAQKEATRKKMDTLLSPTQQQEAPTAPSAPLPAPATQAEEVVSSTQALQELRQRLLGTVKDRAQKVRKSRHFMPIAAALVVVLVFVFIQYNRVFIATVNAYVSPGSIDPQNIIVGPSDDAVVSEESRLIIPKINVDVPVLYDVGADHASQMDAMEKGVAHFSIPGANSHPGERGNTVLSGHSSNDLFDPGEYKFIFAQLEKMNEGDTIYANYKGKRYTYVVTKKEVVKPTQVDKLVYPAEKPILTLITCTPLGTSLNRLLVTAEQVSPNPNEAAAAPESSNTTAEAPMPGNSATLLERLFGRR